MEETQRKEAIDRRCITGNLVRCLVPSLWFLGKILRLDLDPQPGQVKPLTGWC